MLALVLLFTREFPPQPHEQPSVLLVEPGLDAARQVGDRGRLVPSDFGHQRGELRLVSEP